MKAREFLATQLDPKTDITNLTPKQVENIMEAYAMHYFHFNNNLVKESYSLPCVSESELDKLAQETIDNCKDNTYHNGRNAGNRLEGDYGTWDDWKNVLKSFYKNVNSR